MKTLMIAALAWASLGAMPSAQDVPEKSHLPVHSVNDLVLVYYEVQHADPHETLELARSMFGREIFIQERGGVLAHPVENIRRLGHSIVVHDLADYAAKVLANLKQLDQPRAASVAGVDFIEYIEFAPRFVSLRTLSEAIEPFLRKLDTEGREAGRAENITFLKDRNVLLVRETRERLDRIRKILAGVDLPQQQVLITCRVLARAAEADSRLPQELVTNLQRLVPGSAFVERGLAMLQTSVTPGNVVKLKIGTEFQLVFKPVAYDEASGALTVEDCGFFQDEYAVVQISGREQTVKGETRELFSTSTLFRGGEYTVLGASGGELLFVVVELRAIDAGHPSTSRTGDPR